jgi:hypothetical protein
VFRALVQSPTNCLNKITKPRVWGGQGPYKDCRATDDDDNDDMCLGSWGSSISVVSNYRLGDRDSIPGKGEEFFL